MFFRETGGVIGDSRASYDLERDPEETGDLGERSSTRFFPQ
jgi:hypothetical protein